VAETLQDAHKSISSEVNYFVTGSSGFLGKYVTLHLSSEGFKTISPDRDAIWGELECNKNIDLFVHAAGKAHSTKSTEEEKLAFFEVNCELTKRITNQIDQHEIQLNTFIFISTVAVYGIDEGAEINEETKLKGNTPYALSKIMAEEYLQIWSIKKGINLVILRLPLIFGENAPGNLGAMERAIKGRYYFQIGKGTARRSMVHVKQLAEFLPSLIGKSGIYNLTDGYHPTYAEVAEYFGKHHNRRIKSLSLAILNPIARLGDLLPKFPLNSYRLSKLSQSLTYSDQQARTKLGWMGSNALEI
jgi:nucleoside-diphosphate-sugar epimerase